MKIKEENSTYHPHNVNCELSYCHCQSWKVKSKTKRHHNHPFHLLPQVQDSVQNQIKGLQMKLDELKTEHKCNETSSENVISSLTDKLAEVQQSLAQRTEAFNAEGDRSESFLTAEWSSLQNILLHVINPHTYFTCFIATGSQQRWSSKILSTFIDLTVHVIQPCPVFAS